MMKLSLIAITLPTLLLVSANIYAQPATQAELAHQYASCAAYYLLISKADPQLEKYAQVGVAAAENASLLSSGEHTLEMMGQETKRFLAIIEHDWTNAQALISEKAEPCKAIMTIAE